MGIILSSLSPKNALRYYLVNVSVLHVRVDLDRKLCQ